MPFGVQPDHHIRAERPKLFNELLSWAKQHLPEANFPAIDTVSVGQAFDLQGPTGETNRYMMLPRKRVLTVATNHVDVVHQMLAIFAVQSEVAILQGHSFIQSYASKLPRAIRQAIIEIGHIEHGDFDAVLHHGTPDQLAKLQTQVAARQGAIVGITHMQDSSVRIPLERLLIEHAISINTAAAGGNASLMTISE